MEPEAAAAVCVNAMASKPKTRRPPAGADPQHRPGACMTAAQRALLRRLAFDGYEPEAFSEQLTQAEAAKRIAMLQAKLKLMDEPPHVL